MKRLNLKDVASELNWSIHCGDEAFVIQNVTTDCNKIAPGSLLFPLKNKHELYAVLEARQLQHICIVSDNCVDLPEVNRTVTIVKASSTENAYWNFLSFYRHLFNLPVIGVTGTCGKTTTKEMIKHIVEQSGKVQATFYSNNTLGLNSDYLLGIDETTRTAVFEMGVVYPGNLRQSCRCFQPTIGVITTIGIDHLAGCKTMGNYIKAKAELLEGLKYNGMLILNGDNAYIKQIDKSEFRGAIRYFGQGKHCEFRAIDIAYTKEGMEFSLIHENRVYPGVFVPGLGEHNVYNALAAIAASMAATGIDAYSASHRLQSFHHIPRHLEVYQGINGATILDDTWSSNPTSTEAAFEVLSHIGEGKTKIAVLGKMSLLGTSADPYYELVGSKAAVSVHHLVTIRKEAQKIAEAAIEHGLSQRCVYLAATEEAAFSHIRQLANPDTVILIKTSMADSFVALVNSLKGR